MASVDITTSDAIKLAKKFDPAGERTLCALTKADLLSKGQDLRAVLMNDEVPLKYGYVACLGRSPEDMNNHVNVQEGLAKEEAFFRQNYPDLFNMGLVGTTHLVERLSSILGKNIQSYLPAIIKELKDKMDEYNGELQSLGQPMPDSAQDKVQIVMNMVLEFVTAYENSIKGKYTKIKKDQQKEPIGVQIRNLLIAVFGELNRETCLAALSDATVKGTFINFQSSGLPGYPSFSAFQQLLIPLLERFLPRADDLLD